jgi:DNA-binding NarL/FixJ family response regulator
MTTIRVATFDHHPTVLAGMEAILRLEPDLVHVGAAADRYELWPLLHRTQPDVVVLDHRPGSGGLELCLRITGRRPAPRVLLFGADMGPEAGVAATLAGAAAIVDKGAPVRELLESIRAVASGDDVLPAIPPRVQSRAAARLGTRDRAIFAMRLAGTSTAGIAGVLGLGAPELRARLAAIVARLGVRPEPVPGRPRLRVAA